MSRCYVILNNPAQQAAARIRKDKAGDDLLSAAYKDNLVLDYSKRPADTVLTTVQ